MIVIKRDGSKVPFQEEKIYAAISKANEEARKEKEEFLTEGGLIGVVQDVLFELRDKEEISVEEIQDLIEEILWGYIPTLARRYVRYRYLREIRRNTTDKAVIELISGKSEYWNKENSNKDATIVTTQRDYLAGITSTDIAKRFLLPEDVVEAHERGVIHQHDMDYMAQSALHNCDLINLDDMLQNGTVINGVAINKPHRLLTAMTIATQIITAVASSQYGGCTISLSHLAPFVQESEEYLKGKYLACDLSEEQAEKLVSIDLKKEITDAVQTFNYQINSMSTTNGQAPFLSVCMQIDENPKYKRENVLLIEEFLRQRIQGMPNEKGVFVTQAFPKLLYVLDENNVYPNSEYYWLTELAAKCTAKRMVPDYISAKKMRGYKVSPANGTHDVYPCMGCRSFLTPDRTTQNYAKAKNYVKGKSKYYGR